MKDTAKTIKTSQTNTKDKPQTGRNVLKHVSKKSNYTQNIQGAL